MKFGIPVITLVLLFAAWASSHSMPPRDSRDNTSYENRRSVRTPFHKSPSGLLTVGDKSLAAFPSSGNCRVPVLLVQYSNQSMQPGFNAAFYSSLFNGTNDAQLSFRRYYLDMSGNTLNLTCDVYGPFTASGAHDYYGEDYWGRGGDRYPGLLVSEALNAAVSNGVDFSPYDNNGDGKVDTLIVIHSGQGQEESGNSSDIWSFSGDLATEKSAYSDGPGPRTNHGKIIDSFTIQPEYLLVNGLTNATIGVYAHEFGHALGLPDLYDTTGATCGVGDWSLMADGAWNGPDHDGSIPAPMLAWERYWLGWMNLVTPVSNYAILHRTGDSEPAAPTGLFALLLVLLLAAFVQTRRSPAKGSRFPSLPSAVFLAALFACAPSMENARTVVLTGSVRSHTALKIPADSYYPEQYFIAENISRASGGFSAGLPGDGLLITFVHEGILDKYWKDNTVNNGQTRLHGISVIEADANDDLLNFRNQGESDDLFSAGGVSSFSSNSRPPARFYAPLPNLSPAAWAGVDFVLTNITAPGPEMGLNYQK